MQKNAAHSRAASSRGNKEYCLPRSLAACVRQPSPSVGADRCFCQLREKPCWLLRPLHQGPHFWSLSASVWQHTVSSKPSANIWSKRSVSPCCAHRKWPGQLPTSVSIQYFPRQPPQPLEGSGLSMSLRALAGAIPSCWKWHLVSWAEMPVFLSQTRICILACHLGWSIPHHAIALGVPFSTISQGRNCSPRKVPYPSPICDVCKAVKHSDPFSVLSHISQNTSVPHPFIPRASPLVLLGTIEATISSSIFFPEILLRTEVHWKPQQ